MRLALALAALLAAAPAAAHVRLERSTPAAGAILHAPLTELRIVFSGEVAARYTQVTLFAPSGAVVPLDSLRPDAATEGRAFYSAAPRLPEAGEYRLEWRTAGADGHVLTGSFTFTADAGAVQRAAAVDSAASGVARQAPPPQHEHHAASPPGGVFASQSPLHVGVRALQYAALLALVGALVLPRLLRGEPELDEHRAPLGRRLRRFTALLLALFLLLLPVRLWLQSGALHGPARALEPELVAALLTSLTWGHAWLAQVVLAGTAALTFATPLRPLALPAVAALAFTPAFLGHAAGMEQGRTLALAGHGLHVLGAGLWLGTLAALFLVGLPVLRHGDEGDVRRAGAAVHRFSPLALLGAATTVGMGLLLAWLHLGSPGQLAGTAYGRTLAVKLLLIATVLVAGFLNWRRAGTPAATPSDLPALRRRITLELLAAGAVVLVTAVLVAVPTP